MIVNTDLEHLERDRLQRMTFFEEDAYSKGFHLIAGVDEAGRGPLAGPVVAAACIIPRGLLLAKVDDSKKLTSQLRAQLFDILTTDSRIYYSVGIVSSSEIDQINIYQATIQAMKEAVNTLPSKPDWLLVDGMHLPNFSFPSLKLIKGDQLSQSIAAASIIAKVTRDRLMCAYHEKWPVYGFNQHKGYGTRKHLDALESHGPCPIHRYSFEPVKSNSTNFQQLRVDLDLN